ncbi:MAG: hypothetical protein IT243_09595 [Bacteroidia bacterium]|nr:hypothetical protein [Bacteroidia bacterium]
MQIIFQIIVCLLMYGCTKPKEKSYNNKPVYELKIGETLEIYYTTNSCCYYCFAKEQKLEHIEFVEDKTVDKGPKDCDGCDYTSAFVFKAKTVGTDTVRIKNSVASEQCETSDNPTQKYVVIVK